MTVEDRVEATQKQALDWCDVYLIGKDQVATGEEAKKAASKFLKPYLKLNGRIDTEKVEAFLQPRSTPEQLDSSQLAKDGRMDLIEWMLVAGLLKFDATRWKQRKGDAIREVEEVKRYVMPPGEGTPALQVRRK